MGVNEADAAVDVVEEDAALNLFDVELKHFQESIGEELVAGVDRYGLALIHSLPPEQRIRAFEKMGIDCACAADYYNLGTAYAAEDDMDRAVDLWKKALKVDADLSDASFNLAVYYENKGDLSKARELYAHVLTDNEDAEEVELLEQHLAEMGA